MIKRTKEANYREITQLDYELDSHWSGYEKMGSFPAKMGKNWVTLSQEKWNSPIIAQ